MIGMSGSGNSPCLPALRKPPPERCRKNTGLYTSSSFSSSFDWTQNAPTAGRPLGNHINTGSGVFFRVRRQATLAGAAIVLAQVGQVAFAAPCCDRTDQRRSSVIAIGGARAAEGA